MKVVTTSAAGFFNPTFEKAGNIYDRGGFLNQTNFQNLFVQSLDFRVTRRAGVK